MIHTHAYKHVYTHTGGGGSSGGRGGRWKHCLRIRIAVELSKRLLLYYVTVHLVVCCVDGSGVGVELARQM
jgi:hypothetical protein